MNFVNYVTENSQTLFFYAQQHFLVVFFAVGIGSAISITLGLLVDTTGATPEGWSAARVLAGIREGALITTAAALTVPSLALFVLLLPVFGLGATTTVVALTIYSLYIVLRNTVAGLSSVDPAVLESAKGLGMGKARRLIRIQLPLAWPVILNGIRVATLINIAIAAVAALVRGPGLGQLVFAGLSAYGSANAFEQVLAGTLGCLVVAAIYELCYAVVQRFTVPRGIRV